MKPSGHRAGGLALGVDRSTTLRVSSNPSNRLQIGLWREAIIFPVIAWRVTEIKGQPGDGARAFRGCLACNSGLSGIRLAPDYAPRGKAAGSLQQAACGAIINTALPIHRQGQFLFIFASGRKLPHLK